MYYKYSVLSETCNVINGVEEGSYQEIKNKLLGKRHHILSLYPDLISSIKSAFKIKKINSRTLQVFFYDLASRLKMGLNINEAITSLKKASTEPVLTKALDMINEDLSCGLSLAEACSKTGCFPELSLNTIKVGEKTGSLEQVFENLSKYYSQQAEFNLSLKNALLYPFVIFCLLVGIMLYVSFKVIPHLEGLLPEGANAYFATRLLLFLSRAIRGFWPIFLLLPVVLFFIQAKLKDSLKDKLSSFYYKVPLVGKILKDIVLSAFFLNLALLQKNGISLLESFTLLSQGTHIKFFNAKLSELNGLIQKGFSLWKALEMDAFFPEEVYSAIRKAEQIGKLDECLENISEEYSKKVTRELNVFLGLLQPLLLAFCAAFLLLIVLAFIIPVYGNLSNIAGGNVKF